MIGNLQKGLWILSSGAPMFIIFSVAWLVSQSTSTIPIVFISLAALLIVLAFFIFRAMKTKLAVMSIRTKKVTQNDKMIIQYAFSYLLPFASIIWDKINPFITLGVSMVIFLILLRASNPTANPLLFLIGYHFYEVEGENGIGNYLVMSKKDLRNKDELTTVSRVTEYLLLDRSGEK
jgi:hypothetical protein